MRAARARRSRHEHGLGEFPVGVRDGAIPDFDELLAERDVAAAVLDACGTREEIAA
jgi:hypothetical protein